MTSLMCPLSKEKQVGLSLRMPWALPPPGILAQDYCWGTVELPGEVQAPRMYPVETTVSKCALP